MLKTRENKRNLEYIKISALTPIAIMLAAQLIRIAENVNKPKGEYSIEKKQT